VLVVLARKEISFTIAGLRGPGIRFRNFHKPKQSGNQREFETNPGSATDQPPLAPNPSLARIQSHPGIIETGHRGRVVKATD
jgi:hypothetical protein